MNKSKQEQIRKLQATGVSRAEARRMVRGKGPAQKYIPNTFDQSVVTGKRKGENETNS